MFFIGAHFYMEFFPNFVVGVRGKGEVRVVDFFLNAKQEELN